MIVPDREFFKKLALEGNFFVPVMAEVLADTETPVSAYRKIAYDKNEKPYPYSFLLESVEGGENIARYSFLGANPKAVFIHEKGKGRLIDENNNIRPVKGKDVFEEIHNVLRAYKPAIIPGLPPFSGGAVGYASYDVVSEVETTVSQPEKNPVPVPEAVFMITDTLLVFDKVRHTIKIIVHANTKQIPDLDRCYDKALEEVRRIKEKLRHPVTIPTPDIEDIIPDINFSSNKTHAEYCEIVNKTKKYIFEGDIIQAVLSQRFSAEADVSPLSVHRALRMLNPSPYMFLIQCDNFALVGASPEVMAKCIDREITVRPIAGTRKRGKTPEEDIALAKELLADPKECAEHIMLVDLARNDIGRIAETGSVKVEELMTIEKYSHVMHIVSDVKGILRKELDTDAVMRSTFPAGTLSGAPKVRAMQIISEFEKERRGPYGGAVAYYSFDGNFDSCITIRTAILKDKIAYIQAGGGLVADSIPENEFEETCNKAKAMMKAISMARIFEKKN